MAPSLSDEDVGFAQVTDVQEDWMGERDWIGSERDLNEAWGRARPSRWQGVTATYSDDADHAFRLDGDHHSE
jgi:hypothetical protein